MDEHIHATKTVGYHPKPSGAKPFLIILAVIILCGLSFYGGTTYQKDHNKTTVATAATSTNGFGGAAGQGSGGRFSGQRPIRGQVTAVSSTSITVQDATTGTSTTYSITSNTTITDSGQTVSTSDIQTGDTVFIIVSSSSSTQATRILVNPSYGGGQSSQGSSTAPTTTTD